jgi:Phage capsid family
LIFWIYRPASGSRLKVNFTNSSKRAQCHNVGISQMGAPNSSQASTGEYVGLLGDFSHYWIADALSMQIQRLNELYAETNQVGFIGRLETDGAPVLEEAFVRVKLA